MTKEGLEDKEKLMAKFLENIAKTEEESSPEDLKKNKWIYDALEKLINVALENNQLEIPHGEIIECSKVIHIKRYVSKAWLIYNNYDPIWVRGLYILAEGILVPESIMNFISGRHELLYPDRYKKWPDGYNLGTIRRVGTYGFALKKGPLTDTYVKLSSAWEFLDLSLD